MPIVTKLDSGRWRVQWRDRAGRKLGPQPPRSFATKTAARNFGLDREAEVRAGVDVDPKAGQQTLAAWIEEWLASRVAEPRTLSKMAGHLRRHVLVPVGDARALGELRLDQVDELVLQGWVKRLQAAGLAPSTIEGVFTSLATVLRAAVRSRKLPVDPTQDVTRPRLPPPSDFFWERDEIDAVREQMGDLQDRSLFELLIGTGVRWGEAVGLHLPRWAPLRRRLSVVEVLSEEQGFALKAYPKGGRRRDVPAVTGVLLESMAAHLAAQPAVSCSLHRPCPGLVFHQDGRPLSRHAWPRQVFAPALAAAGVRRGRVHDLRHTYASWLVLDGVPLRVVQELLGHASSRTTERYAHLAPSALDDPRLTASLTGRAARERESFRESGS